MGLNKLLPSRLGFNRQNNSPTFEINTTTSSNEFLHLPWTKIDLGKILGSLKKIVSRLCEFWEELGFRERKRVNKIG